MIHDQLLSLASGSTAEEMLRAAILAQWQHLVWRHHGIGALQAYVREHTNPEVRVHIWSPKLVRPGIIGHGNAHDHRFELTSYVLAGALRDTQYNAVADINGDWSVSTVEHARSAGPQRNYDGEHSAPVFHCYVDPEDTIIGAGRAYHIRRGDFHSTVSDAPVTVTVCAMSNKQGTARILVPRGEEPVHAFGEEFLTPEEILWLLKDARALIAGNNDREHGRNAP